MGIKDMARAVDDRMDEAVGADSVVGTGADAPPDAEHEQDVVGEPGRLRDP
ncbi:hypothetical protein ACIQ6K_19865 [Streptomyces sp. NPDC096354]|uniref:hypothetical protein n=1 Tax=Streptomyces sp. NPDC096354 TaxID=3366088 RepID=UPI0037F41A7B